MTPDETVTVKGSPVRSLQKFIEADLTAEQKDVLYRKLPPEPAARFRSPILPNEPVPVHLLNRVTEEAARIKGEPLELFARRAGREAADDAVRGLYRIFALVLTPTTLLAKAGQMWRSVYNTGELRVERPTGSRARISLLGFPCEAAGCLRFTGWIEKLAEMTAVKDVKIQQTKCFSRGDGHCEWQLSWR